ncbi:MAG: hypothetical protein M5U10_06300 [Candidatus Methanoperedens sp.]|nr:hypothetical protein [Candidatus Methanoperedens nitroreducens]MDJ1421508.1 hypothetical protein [Candidatus Methanoperedens sp.]
MTENNNAAEIIAALKSRLRRNRLQSKPKAIQQKAALSQIKQPWRMRY